MTTQCDRTIYMDETSVPIVIELDIPALERLRAAAGIQGPYLAIRDISGDSSRLCGCSERLDRMQAQFDEISRSHRLLDDRTADSAADLRQQLDFTAGDVRRLTAALQAALKRVAALEGKVA